MTAEEYNHCTELYADSLYRFLLKHIRQEETAQDIVQDSFEKLWIRRSEVDAAKARSYLFTTAYHTLVDHTRKAGRIRFTDMLPAQPGAHPVAPDLGDILEKALETLPAIQKSVLLLRDYEGYSYEEIGEITQLSEAQVKVYIYRARNSMKNYIGSLERVL